MKFKLEWQVFRDTENGKKSRKSSRTRKTQKITENSIFWSKTKIQAKKQKKVSEK